MSAPEQPVAARRRLDSWKEIAAYLGRSERTVRRWEEHEGLPVHRLQHQERGSVYAFADELEEWRLSRGAELEPKQGDDAVSASPPQVPPEVLPEVLTGSPTAEPGRAARRRLLGAAFVCALVVLGGFGGYLRLNQRTDARPTIRSLAILPLDNLSGDPSQEYLADGMTEELITSLAQLDQLRVLSRTTVMRFKASKAPLPEIARQLDVDGIVEGSVRRSGSRVGITVQLIDGRTDHHLWSQSYEREFSDVIALQAEVSRAITAEIQGKLRLGAPEPMVEAASRSPEGEEAYLQGLYHLNKGSLEEIRKGIASFTEAVARDPHDARNYAGIANAYLWLSDYYLPSATILPLAKEAALKAVSAGDTLAESHVALGAVSFLYDWDWSAAEREFQRAIALSPGSADAHIWYATYLAQAGRAAQAIDEVAKAEALDPLSLPIRGQGGWVYYLARQPARARAEWRKILDLEPQFAFSHTTIWAAYLGGDDFMRSRLAAETPTSPGSPGTPSTPSTIDGLDLAARIGAQATAGNRSGADALIHQLRMRAAHEYFCPYEMATASAVLGRNDEAFEWLDKAVAERSACVPSIKLDPRLDSLHDDKRFAAVLRAGHFPQ